MPIAYDQLMAMQIEPAEQAYEPKDCMLYALGVGLGHDPLNEDELAFVYEKNLKVLPTMATVLGHTGSLAQRSDTGINWLMVVNGEQGFTLHRPLTGRGVVIGRTKIVEVVDKGAGKGALIFTERAISDKTSGAPIATVTQTIFCRGDGGFGGPPRQTPPPHPMPARAPDVVCDLGTRPEMALIYRLSGDYNPLHAEPAFAKAAGYERPILHGLGTFGVSGHALLKTMCGYDPARLVSFAGRFSGPVLPGETIRTEMWQDGTIMSFRARVLERDVIAINHGRAEVRS
ncbi:MAG: MaoC family dehydratase N-terminal domain-containing protein [Hyphomicrobiales bacterium]|nr:MaoC family dehydratase N-terminal domain-containing protein [Hyphomicrobiales bacterium]MDE1972101.1 MaoC family dehydratase N-terminal domain-containing protein [Hyphomicrobiales bacterium]MDE2285458.1 MaoC family dehydratase N-terminal domain-containing protein [Hyphomicrobiales bacterium]